MEKFFVGLCHECDAWPFQNVMISQVTLERRMTDFKVNDWMLDSGAFSELSKFGKHRLNAADYARRINRWARCGRLLAAVAQDWMCEAFVLVKTGLNVQAHQALTIKSYFELSDLSRYVPVLPVLQGFTPAEYASHVRQYGDALKFGQWVGVGSVCQRNDNPDAIEDVLLAIKSERADLKLHGFGLKKTAIERATIRDLLYSSDSMAWSHNLRKNGRRAHDPRVALRYSAAIEELIGRPTFVQNQLFKWWKS